MDEKIRDRRRSVNRQRGRRRGGLVLVAVLLLVAVALFLWLRSSDVFAVKRITATATQRTTEQQICGLTSVALGASLLTLSTGAIEEALLTLPYIRSAEVYRRFPDTLDARLVEYEPVARLRVETGATWLVAENGRALEKVSPPRGSGLPLVVAGGALTPVVGETVPGPIVDALQVVSLLKTDDIRERMPAVERIVVSAAGTIAVVLKGGSELRLGDATELEHKLMVAIDRIQQYLRDGRRIEYVDLTVPERVAVKAE
jgi:cell division protein FtsQ